MSVAPHIPYWLSVMQALATPAIALLAAVIGAMQWRTARQKLVLDLFEKRFQVFLDVRRIVSHSVQLGKLDDYGQMNEVIARGRFLFGDDINDSLKEMHALIVKLEVGDLQAHTEINNLFNRMLPIFSLYLKMPQKASLF